MPEDQRITYRMGINIGDIIVEGDDIYGDGVNVAARLEGLADPGGICVSRTVFNHVKGKVEVGFEDRGAQEVKNIPEPVHVYRVCLADADQVGRTTTPEALPLPDKPSIAVLPFVNMSGDPEQEYFSDGITEDITTILSKISELFVIARNSSFTYKGQAVRVQQVSKELGVRYVLEGSVRKVGKRVRITSQLIDARSGGHLWSERFDRDLTDIFAVQDDVTQKIVSALELQLTGGEQERLPHKGTDNVEAYDHLLRGREIFYQFTKETNTWARKMFETAITLDPAYALAYSDQSRTYLAEWNQGWSTDPARSLNVAHELALKALELDGTLPEAHCTLGHVLVWKKQHESAIAELERCVTLDPNHADGYAYYAFAMNWSGRPKEATAPIEKAMRLDPRWPVFCTFVLGQAYFEMGRYEDSIVVLKRAADQDRNFMPNHFYLAVAYGLLGGTDEAAVEVEELERLSPGMNITHMKSLLPFKHPENLDRCLEGLRKAGLPE